jgi:hypothetical protein
MTKGIVLSQTYDDDLRLFDTVINVDGATYASSSYQNSYKVGDVVDVMDDFVTY